MAGSGKLVMVSTVIVSPSPWQFLGTRTFFWVQEVWGTCWIGPWFTAFIVSNALWYHVHSSTARVRGGLGEWTLLWPSDGSLPCQVTLTWTWGMQSPKHTEFRYSFSCSSSCKWELLTTLHMGFLGLFTISTSLDMFCVCLSATSPPHSQNLQKHEVHRILLFVS